MPGALYLRSLKGGAFSLVNVDCQYRNLKMGIYRMSNLLNKPNKSMGLWKIV